MPRNQPYSKFSPLFWDTECLSQNPAIVAGEFPLSTKALSRAYPTRALRYWFIYHFLRQEFQQLSRPLSICEVGIDTGQMLQFMQSVGDHSGGDVASAANKVEWSSWTGVDSFVQDDKLAKYGYTQLVEANVEETDSWMTGDDDVVVLLHVVEHLYDPENLFARIVPRMKPGNVLVGGFPSVPDWCAKLREPTIRANPNANGHVSALSPKRLRNMARDCGLQVDFLSGAFFLRASGLFLEDYAWWLRFNVAFGGLFPSWPGEIYWVLRKPSGSQARLA